MGPGMRMGMGRRRRGVGVRVERGRRGWELGLEVGLGV